MGGANDGPATRSEVCCSPQAPSAMATSNSGMTLRFAMALLLRLGTLPSSAGPWSPPPGPAERPRLRPGLAKLAAIARVTPVAGLGFTRRLSSQRESCVNVAVHGPRLSEEMRRVARKPPLEAAIR